MMSDDAVVLDYYDCLLRSSDLMLLNESLWINDNLIGFAFEYVINLVVVFKTYQPAGQTPGQH